MKNAWFEGSEVTDEEKGKAKQLILLLDDLEFATAEDYEEMKDKLDGYKTNRV